MSAKVGHNLPASATNVIGREDVIDLICDDVKRGGLTSILGAGGIGKTTVALAVAERAIGSYADGIWLVDFASLHDPSLVCGSIANAVGLNVHSADVQNALSRYLRDRKMLLILDNCEHMAEAISSSIRQIVAKAPGISVLATSRTALRVDREHAHRLPGLDIPLDDLELTANSALKFSAIQLFVDRARERQEDFVLNDADAPVVVDICRKLDGIALAIELAAMRIDVFGLRNLRTQLDDRFRILAGRRGGLERHRTMAATLDWSYGLLSEQEADLLQTVSVFAGSFDVDDASTAFDVPREDAADMLSALASQSLLVVDAAEQHVMYRPLESTRAYCLAKLSASGREPEVRLRHAQHTWRRLERAEGELQESHLPQLGLMRRRLLADLRAALAWLGAAPAHRILLINLTAAATTLWNQLTLTDESRIHLIRAIAELHDAGMSGTSVEMNLQLKLAGALLFTRGNVQSVREAVSHALRIANLLSDQTAQLQCMRLMATHQLFSGHPKAATQTLEDFLSIASTEDPAAYPEGETHLGVGEIFTGKLPLARRRMERLSANMREDFIDSTFTQYQYSNSVVSMLVLSHAQWLTDSPDIAIATMNHVVEHASSAGHELSYSIALAWDCMLSLWAGRWNDCERQATMLQELCERHGIVMWRPVATFCRGTAAGHRTKDLSEAIELMEEAIADFKAIGHLARMPYYIAVLAEALSRQGRVAEAVEKVHEALALAEAQDERWCLPEILRLQASIDLVQGLQDMAEDLLLKSIATADAIHSATWRLRACNDLARLWHSHSRGSEALQLLQTTLDAVSGSTGPDIVTAHAILSRLQ
jgi:predicted ATPase